MDDSKKARIASLVSMAAKGVIDHVENTLYEYAEEGREITRSEIETMLESGVKLTMTESEWHMQKALQETVDEMADIEDMLENYEPK